MKKRTLIALCALVAPALAAPQPVTDADVIRASDALLAAPGDAKAWQPFQEIVRSDAYDPAIRSRAMYLFAVNHLQRMNTNLFASALQALRTRYPEEGVTLAERLTPADWLARCPACRGTGLRNGGATAADTPSRCLECRGTGSIFQLGPRVGEQTGALLNEIKALADDNLRFADASKKALAENQPPRRLAALRALVEQFAHRRDLEPARQALAAVEAEVAKAEEEARQKAAARARREQEDKDYQTICTGLENLAGAAIPVMVQEIDRFLAAFPQSPNRLELEIVKAKLQQRQKTRALLWTGARAVGALALLSVLVALIKEWLHARQRRATGPLPVPGLTQQGEDSDPLAGTFDDDGQP